MKEFVLFPKDQAEFLLKIYEDEIKDLTVNIYDMKYYVRSEKKDLKEIQQCPDNETTRRMKKYQNDLIKRYNEDIEKANHKLKEKKRIIRSINSAMERKFELCK